jgi:ring-1,2-phenylacetyl-CoA epoxidase subunit PaaE
MPSNASEASRGRFHALTVGEIRRETKDSVSIALVVPEASKADFAFAPGQFLTLRVIIDGEEVRRSYSICSAPQDGELRIGVRRVEGGAFSTFANENLKPGDILEAMPPEGRFTPAPGVANRHILLIAAGSGITPVLSIARATLVGEPASRVTLIYGNRTSASVMFAEAVEDLKDRHLGRFAVTHVMSRELQDVALLSGRITGDKLRELAEGVVDLRDVDEAFVCGPEAMISEARDALVGLGVSAERISAELFAAASPRASYRPQTGAAPGEVQARITVTLDGKRHAFDLFKGDESLIEAAARNGVDIPFSCRGGMCCTCRCRVEAGAAAMAVNYSLEAWELEAGFVLACQARPTTEDLAVNFDAM